MGHVRSGLWAMLVLLMVAGAAQGSVTIKITADYTGLNNALSVIPGGAFDAYVKLVSSAEETTAVSYLLTQVSGPTAAALRITARDLSGSAYPDASFDNATVTSLGDATLDPTTNKDLGGLITNPMVPIGGGTHHVAKLTILTSASAVPGNYVIGPFNGTGTTYTEAVFNGVDYDYVEHTTSLADSSPLQVQNLVVTITPEPVGLAMIGLLGLMLFRRR